MNSPGSLPAVKARLEQTLAQWRQWRCDPILPGGPHLDCALDGGLSNHNFLVGAAGQQYVVRVDGINPNRHGLNRQVEFLALQSASDAGLAPTPRYFNPELAVLVCDYLPPDPIQRPAPADLASLCRQIHSLPDRHHRLDLPGRVRRYESLLKRAAKPLPPRGIRQAIEQKLSQSTALNVPATLCHNDLLPANLIISDGKLLALDWEYVAMGNPWFDLAVACAGQNYNPEQIDYFLSHYLQRDPNDNDTKQLTLFGVLYRYLELLWHLEQLTADAAAAHLDANLHLVERELH
ncbi:MAG: choline kinase family protein [Halioglobus sp.]